MGRALRCLEECDRRGPGQVLGPEAAVGQMQGGEIGEVHRRIGHRPAAIVHIAGVHGEEELIALVQKAPKQVPQQGPKGKDPENPGKPEPKPGEKPKLLVKGAYADDKREGIWYYYSIDGTPSDTVKYHLDFPQDQ